MKRLEEVLEEIANMPLKKGINERYVTIKIKANYVKTDYDGRTKRFVTDYEGLVTHLFDLLDDRILESIVLSVFLGKSKIRKVYDLGFRFLEYKTYSITVDLGELKADEVL